MALNVSLVIPGRDVASVVHQCINAVAQLPEGQRPAEVIFVDDGSVDETSKIVSEFSIRHLRAAGGGPGAARNVGWRAAIHPLIWFIDADCVPEPDALAKLLPHLDDPQVAGVGGSYGNLRPNSLLACLIHEEIVERHAATPQSVNHLGTFNALYRRKVLEQLGGFDERYITAEDTELTYRVRKADYQLRFEPRSRVGHFHPTQLGRYLQTQRRHGFWRACLYTRYPTHAVGDSYSGLVDHLQPVLAVFALFSTPLLVLPPARWLPVTFIALLVAAQAPMTWRIVRRTRQIRFIGFAVISFLRSFSRGTGMAAGVIAALPARAIGRV